MSAEALENLTNPEAQRAAARSRAYAALAQAFEYPDAELCDASRSGELEKALRGILEAVDPGLCEDADWEALADPGEGDDLAVEFTRLFDVGASGPPCPLYGGLYGGARMKNMEEAVRFYNHFGLTLSESPRELPDHVTTELEFLHFLCYREAETIESGQDPDAYRRAQRDFITRHPGRWIPLLRKRLESENPMRFFLELVRRIESLLALDRAYLVGLVGPVPDKASGGSPSATAGGGGPGRSIVPPPGNDPH
ncbi:MAG: molecular chaperone TorD family protein [Deltaproteobacteria bacterium]|nr:molecular chaperone TorD family protein [Deltaproteobacteria bacterium]MBW2418412.1 molecular chaperone TorD family protein [Deltaproteobacteria bacterium]